MFTTPARIQESRGGSHIDPQNVCRLVNLLEYVLSIILG